MPCTDGGPSIPSSTWEDDEDDELVVRLNRATRLLCYVLTVLEKDAPRYLTHSTQERTEKEAPMLQVWWEEHKKAGAARRAKEQAKEKEEQDRIEALQLLTPAQRKALAKMHPQELKRALSKPVLGSKHKKQE